MRIEALQLENIRSHIKTTVSFSRGFNCLVGGLGRGKSSILYAIDFALFGDPLRRSYDYLLRNGADIGKVTLKFVQGGKPYTLHRMLRTRKGGISQDKEQLKLFEEDRLIASVKGEAVAEQLEAVTGFDKELFREVVWMRQERLKELLNATPRDRQTRLDQLFGLSNYEAAWSSLAGFQREYEGEKKSYERDFDVIGRKRLQAEYNKAVEEFSQAEVELEELREKFTQAEVGFHEAKSRLQNLQDLRKQTEELGKRETQLQTNITNIEDSSARLADEIQRKKLVIKNFEERLRSIEAKEKSHRDGLREQGLKSDQPLEQLRQYLSALGKQMASVGGEQEAVKSEMLTSQWRISSLTTENRCPLCFQGLTGEYKKGLLERLYEENAARETELGELQKKFDELEKLRGIIDSVVLNLQSLVPQVEEQRRRDSDEHESLKNLSAEFGEKQQLEKTFRDQLSAVRSEMSNFDITELETARTLRDEVFTQYSNVKYRLETVKSRKRDLTSRVDELKERLDNAQQKVERMEKIERLLGIIDGIRGAYRSIQPKLRSEFVTYLQRVVQQVLDGLVGEAGRTLMIKIDETYSPLIISEEGFERDVSNLSGGERTLLAFAYRIGLGQLIMQSRTGHGLYMLLLDEPTESLGREDGSVDRLAEAISRLKAIEQIIAETNSEAFAEKSEHVIRVDKEDGMSRVFVEK
ncbi:MAG: SMC family ATPase [Candidatus Bathyarchaeota archaeon]|nr:MAG: SMC family ATPase [Candidatus Bathyarchaeota archaeon]